MQAETAFAVQSPHRSNILKIDSQTKTWQNGPQVIRVHDSISVIIA